MKLAKKKKKKIKYTAVPENCGGKKCGSAFEWKVIDIATDIRFKKAA